MDAIPDLTSAGVDYEPLELNDLLLDHPAASYVFRSGPDVYLIVDRAMLPRAGSLVLVQQPHGYTIQPFTGQESWGVITYKVCRVVTVLICLAIYLL